MLKSLILKSMANGFLEPKEDNIETLLNKKKRHKSLKRPKDSIAHNAEIIRQMMQFLASSPLKDDLELNSLLIMSKAQIYKIPVKHPFKRKSFIYNLKKITARLEDKKFANEMERTASQLPTSKDSVAAFIVNEALNSSEKIGYDLIAGALGTTEHLKPTQKGGKNELNNIALASKYKNNMKAHTDLAILMKKEPEIYEYCQRHINRLIELYNNGIFKKVGLSKGYILNLKERLEKLSPKENPLVLDISALES